jgi:hypothetical protein
MTNTVFPRFQTQYISHQQAVAEHWDLPNTEILQSKDVASAHYTNSGGGGMVLLDLLVFAG